MSFLKKLASNTSGATAIEYGLLIALIGMVFGVGLRFASTGLWAHVTNPSNGI